MDMENERLRTKSNSLNKTIIFSFSPLLVCMYCFCSQLAKPFDGSYTYKRKKRASTNGQRSWSCVVCSSPTPATAAFKKRQQRAHTHNNVLIEIDKEQFEKVWQSKFSRCSCCHHRLFQNLEGWRKSILNKLEFFQTQKYKNIWIGSPTVFCILNQPRSRKKYVLISKVYTV